MKDESYASANFISKDESCSTNGTEFNIQIRNPPKYCTVNNPQEKLAVPIIDIKPRLPVKDHIVQILTLPKKKGIFSTYRTELNTLSLESPLPIV